MERDVAEVSDGGGGAEREGGGADDRAGGGPERGGTPGSADGGGAENGGGGSAVDSRSDALGGSKEDMRVSPFDEDYAAALAASPCALDARPCSFRVNRRPATFMSRM